MAARSGETGSQFGQTATPIRTADIPFSVRSARGLISGSRTLPILARSVAPITSSATLWTDITSHPIDHITTATTVDIVSSATTDNFPSGSGAREVFIWGLPNDRTHTSGGENPPWQSEIIEMDGTTPVTSVNEYFSIDGAEVLTAGPFGFNLGPNLGDIDISITGGSDQIRIPVGRGVSRSSRMSIPIGWVGLLRKLQVFWTAAAPALVELREFSPISGGGIVHTRYDGEITMQNSGNEINLEGGIPIKSQSTIWFRARRSVGPASESMQINAWIELDVDDDSQVAGVPIIE